MQAPLWFKTSIAQRTAELGEEFLLTPFLFINIAREQKNKSFIFINIEREAKTDIFPPFVFNNIARLSFIFAPFLFSHLRPG